MKVVENCLIHSLQKVALHAIQKVLDGDWVSYKASNQTFNSNFSLEDSYGEDEGDLFINRERLSKGGLNESV